ncbi:MAG: right-handed parallel beta-helix repeat-containing protein, partial [Planctomycetota bacterium]
RVIVVNGGQGLDTVIEGFTITGGATAGRGAGMLVVGASPTVRNCRFVENEANGAGSDGGGVYLEFSASVFEDCQFTNNFADNVGGGAYNRDGTNTSFLRCTFEGNVAELGGGLAGGAGADITIGDCDFLANGHDTKTEDGGGVWIWSSTTMTMDRCRFEGNEVFDDGGGVLAQSNSVLTMRNTIFQANVSASNAGAFYSWDGAHIAAFHCTLIGNVGVGTSAFTSNGGTIEFRNGIVWDGDGSAVTSGGGITVSYSTVEGGAAGANNRSDDPMLDAELRPTAGSPAIDAGDSYVLLGEDPVDYDGSPRAVDDPATPDANGRPVYGLVADMGAFEFQPEGTPPTCTGDVNGDGAVDADDLVLVVLAWGVCN